MPGNVANGPPPTSVTRQQAIERLFGGDGVVQLGLVELDEFLRRDQVPRIDPDRVFQLSFGILEQSRDALIIARLDSKVGHLSHVSHAEQPMSDRVFDRRFAFALDPDEFVRDGRRRLVSKLPDFIVRVGHGHRLPTDLLAVIDVQFSQCPASLEAIFPVGIETDQQIMHLRRIIEPSGGSAAGLGHQSRLGLEDGEILGRNLQEAIQVANRKIEISGVGTDLGELQCRPPGPTVHPERQGIGTQGDTPRHGRPRVSNPFQLRRQRYCLMRFFGFEFRDP